MSAGPLPLWRRVFRALFLLGLVLGAWAFWWEPSSLRVTDRTLTLPGWPSGCDGLRVAVLADLHVGSPYNGRDKLAHIVEVTNETRPDLVLAPGDFVIQGVLGGSFVAPEETARELARLRAPLGTHAVLGNHDWWLDGPRVAAAFEAAGVPVQDDRATVLEQGDCRFALVGVSDYKEGPHDLAGALAQAEAGLPILLMTHDPDLFPSVPAEVTLTLAGHTHGGQVYLPGIGRPVVPSLHGDRYAYGHVVEDGRHLFVAPGIGTSILPVRFLVPPEITLLELRSAAP